MPKDPRGIAGPTRPAGVQFWDDPTPPARSVREYVEQQRAAFQAARSGAAAIVARFRQAAGPDFARALEGGAALAGTASGLGASLGPVGIVGGAIAGFFGGLVAGIVPTERNAAEGRWDALLATLTPVERYGLFSAVRPLALRNARAEGKVFEGGTEADPCGPWRWADDPLLGHSPWGGPIGRTVNLVERVFRLQVIPSQCATDTPEQKSYLALYTLLFAAGAHDDGKRPWQMRALWPLLAEGPAMGPLVGPLGQFSQPTLGELRARARSWGIRNIWNPVLTPGIRAAMNAESRR